MPVEFWDWVERRDLLADRRRWFVFGDNLERRGRGGLAAECRGEPNAIGVAVKLKPSMEEDAFFSDAEFDFYARVIDADLQTAFFAAQRKETIIIPASGIGTGLARLPDRAPRLFRHVRQRISELRWEANRGRDPGPFEIVYRRPANTNARDRTEERPELPPRTFHTLPPEKQAAMIKGDPGACDPPPSVALEKYQRKHAAASGRRRR